MIRYIRLILALIGILAIVMLAIDNREPVDIVFWPLPFSISLPLYGVFLIGLIGGALLGGIAVWLSGLSERAEARRLRRRIKAIDYQEQLRREAAEQAAVEDARAKTQSLAISAPHA